MNSPINDDRNLYTVFKYGRTQQLYCKWTAEEDMLLRDAVSKFGTRKWTCVSNQIPGRTAIQCSTRWMGTLNSNIHKGKWSKEESKALYDAVEFYQKLSDSHQDQQQLPWNLVAENVPCRNGIQCQARWTETLDPSIRKGRWSADEDRLLHDAKKKYGCCWVRVATMIPTRTQRQCRTRWNQIHSHRKRKIQKTCFDFSSNNYNNTSCMEKRRPTVKLPDPINTYFPNLKMDDILNQLQPLIFSPDYPSSSYSFDEPLESPDMVIPLQDDNIYKKPSLDGISHDFIQEAIHPDVYLL